MGTRAAPAGTPASPTRPPSASAQVTFACHRSTSPRTATPLGGWIRTQRKQYHAGRLDPDRDAALVEVTVLDAVPDIFDLTCKIEGAIG